jgi:F-type H+-transporting ATPase subunit epsilon
MLRLTVVTPEGQAYDDEVESVVLPGSEGRFGVLERHERFLAPLQIGVMEVRSKSGSELAAVSSGFADVSAEQVVVLVDRCRMASTANAAAARSQRDAIQADLDKLSGSPEDAAKRAPLEMELRFLDAVIEVARA